MYVQALMYQIFYKNITFTKPAYFSMVYYHITFHDLNIHGTSAIHTPRSSNICRTVITHTMGCTAISLSLTHTIFKTHLALTDGVDTHNRASAFSPSHACTCVYVCIHSVIQFKSCISSELFTGVIQTSGTSWK